MQNAVIILATMFDLRWSLMDGLCRSIMWKIGMKAKSHSESSDLTCMFLRDVKLHSYLQTCAQQCEKFYKISYRKKRNEIKKEKYLINFWNY